MKTTYRLPTGEVVDETNWNAYWNNREVEADKQAEKIRKEVTVSTIVVNAEDVIKRYPDETRYRLVPKRMSLLERIIFVVKNK